MINDLRCNISATEGATTCNMTARRAASVRLEFRPALVERTGFWRAWKGRLESLVGE